METMKSRLCSLAATLMSVIQTVALAVTQLHLIVADVLLTRDIREQFDPAETDRSEYHSHTSDRHKRCTRPVRCSPCV